jgi:stage V sporulation protein G
MEITEVRVSLRDGGNRKLKAYATMTFDNAFVVRNVKVIEGNKGLFVAMPSRKLREACHKCNYKNAVRSKFCNQCGSSLPMTERKPQAEGDQMQQSEHRDIAHPITLECREYIQKKVLEAYETERKKGPSSPGQHTQERPKEQEPAGHEHEHEHEHEPEHGHEPEHEPKQDQGHGHGPSRYEDDDIEGGDIEL